ncbi:hypothetical protein FH972_022971 [Carpinus fangiana]|uniref:NAD(P)-binding domain-containing protein n=1 Tax=Carpinus fangiana TaxID=176857 RepID=A0A5N6KUA3_9ROSI|nr:hypothetical protein FH972_022971 [Carpinus fangiana]
MKIVITGATGRIGAGVVNQCLACPEVTSIIALSRREPAVSHPKLEWVKHEDFTVFEPTVLSRLQGTDVCIYCLGTLGPQNSLDENRRFNLDYALSTARVFADYFASNDHSDPFRFIYLSGALVEKDRNRTLWFLSDTRKMRGELENALVALGREKASTGFNIHIVRPGIVLVNSSTLACAAALSLVPAIRRDYLWDAITQIAIGGSEKTTIENAELIRIGKTPSHQPR